MATVAAFATVLVTWSNRAAVVVVIPVVLTEEATMRASWPVPVPTRNVVPTGMFAIPPAAKFMLVVPAVDAVLVVASAAPDVHPEHPYRVWVTFCNSTGRHPGGTGKPVFGVTPACPT